MRPGGSLSLLGPIQRRWAQSATSLFAQSSRLVAQRRALDRQAPNDGDLVQHLVSQLADYRR
jgi:hypothetical protein